MRDGRSTLRVWLVTSALLATTVGAGAVGAQEYCVACAGPAAVYRCVIDKAVPGAMPLSQLCATEMARRGGHEACAVQGGTVFDCTGPIRRVGTSAGGDPTTGPASPSSPTTAPTTKHGAPRAAAGPVAAPGRAPVDPTAAGKPGEAPTPAGAPGSVEELARGVSGKAEEGMSTTGNAIGNAAQKSWKCLTSFFKSC